MSDSTPDDDLFVQVQELRERWERAGKNGFAKLCGPLARRGVEQVRIAYDGYGDEGVIERITAWAGEREIELDEETRQALESAAYRLLPGGWDEYHGSFGELVLHVRSHRLVREHSWRIESTEYDEEAIDL